jgi:hypothetical protein
LAKLGDFKTPTGASGNIFNINDLLSMIVGAFLLIITFAVGQNLANKMGSKLPIDTQIDQPWQSPQIVPVGKGREVL